MTEVQAWPRPTRAGFRRKLVRLLVLLFLASLLEGGARAGEACCAITAIDAKIGVVTAREAKTGRKFQFKVADAALLKSLKVGQKIDADFTAQKVSVDGITHCCAIVQGAPPSGANRAKEKAAPQEPPCCSLTAIDRTTRVVSARNRTSGQEVSFKVNHTKFLASLRVGQSVDLANIGGGRLVVRTDAAEVEAIRIP